MLIEIRDDVIWAKQLRADHALYDAVIRLREDETIRLTVDGETGLWRKMKTGRDGRPTQGIKPVGETVDFWRRMQDKRGQRVPIESADDEDDDYLRYVDRTFVEWYSAEDEEAFRDLQPL